MALAETPAQGTWIGRAVDFVLGTRAEALPEELVGLGRRALLDTVGVALAGWHEPVVGIVAAVYAEPGWAAPPGARLATLWGDGRRVAPASAALINGTAAHALDFDDVTPTILAHPSAPVLAAALAAGEAEGRSLGELVAAWAVGTELMIRLGQPMGFRHYELGWHATATLGVLGAAAAAGRLMGLDGGAMARALGVAASMAGGLRRNFGTMTKPLHVGLAAARGLEVAELARRGLTADAEVFGPGGFYRAFSGGALESAEAAAELPEFGRPWDFLATGLSVKRFPCCYETHRIIQAALELRAEASAELAELAAARVTTPPGGMAPLIHHRPESGLEAKFSAEYTLLAALADGDITFESFLGERVRRPEIRSALPRVAAGEAPGAPAEAAAIDEAPVVVELELRDGRRLRKEVMHAPGSPVRPLSDGERLGKWETCLAWYGRNAEGAGGRTPEAARGFFAATLEAAPEKPMAAWLDELQRLLAGRAPGT